ncbi:MAG TPA: FG-GAP-like repeat-containing protein [Armatimonadota bacterium]|nr:FG-GAP-like repeat-containing protein [Armatimonadota bacterium]
MPESVVSETSNPPQLVMRWEKKLELLHSVPVPYPSAEAPDSVIAIASQAGAVIRVDGAGREIFRHDLGDRVSAAPAVVDLDGDGAPEIVAGRVDGLVVALTADGKELWRHRLGELLDEFKCVVAAPVTSDGRPSLLLADDGGWVNCLDAAGRLRWRFKIDSYAAAPPAVGDLDGDGSPEIVYGTEDHRVVCISADGRLRWVFEEPANFGRSLALIADLGSGPEVLITNSSSALSGHLFCLNGATGRPRWTAELTQQAYAALVVADVNRDGRPEIIAADKGNTVFCFDGEGRRLWATAVGGRAVFWSPAVADVDGDGELEIVVGTSHTGVEGHNFYVLTTQGRVKGEYTLGNCQETAPVVGDIDGDGVLEVVTSSPNSDLLRCFTFGGPARAGAVVSACLRGASTLGGSALPPSPVQPAPAIAAPAGKLVEPLEAPRLGTNALSLRLPKSAPERALIEVSRRWGGQRSTRVHDLRDDGAVSVELMPGDQEVEITLIDGATGERVCAEEMKFTGVGAPAAGEERGGEAYCESPQRRRERLLALAEAVTREAPEAAAARQLVAAADAFHESVRIRSDFHRFKVALGAAGWSGSFAAWQDDNPWDNVQPLGALPAQAAPQPTIEVWALGNEHEHAALNLVALEGRPLTIHAAVKGLEGRLELLRPVWMPTKYGDGRIPDMLLKSASAAVVDLTPGEPCQLWLHFATRGLEAGVHEAVITLTSLEKVPSSLAIKVRLEVSPVTLPDQPRMRVCNWRRVAPDGSGGLDDRVWSDLREHGVTVVMVQSCPRRKADEQGNLVGDPDWSRFDDSMRRLVGGGALVLFNSLGASGPPKAVQAAAVSLDAHLHSIGIGNESWAYYPVDEPCLFGDESVELFMRAVRPIKEVAPNIRIYANPSGAVRAEYLERMNPYTDIWCPELHIVKQGSPDLMRIMREGGRQVWTYQAPGDVRFLTPLGFYRAQHWVAVRHGLDGSGWWVYAYHNLWGVGAQEPMYGVVQIEPDQTLTTTRRWEASRDGIEDTTLVHLLDDAIGAAAARGADVSAARALRQEALDAVAAYQDAVDVFTLRFGEYEMDFGVVQRYRRLLAEAIVELGS